MQWLFMLFWRQICTKTTLGGQPGQCGQRGGGGHRGGGRREGGHNWYEKKDEEMVYKITKEKPFFLQYVPIFLNGIVKVNVVPWWSWKLWTTITMRGRRGGSQENENHISFRKTNHVFLNSRFLQKSFSPYLILPAKILTLQLRNIRTLYQVLHSKKSFN